ncbi:hypothetical protein RRF57_005257 [Xylaria bambusicola]|uniref:Uncharacterized protein n=1 Tax=Xylaria bambusicola TaxID=326684 RepID=A0AAN7Z5T2_9PEZI
MNTVIQDAFLGRATEFPYLNILNHIGLQYDENALTEVPDEFMRAVGPDNTVRQLEEEWSALEAKLQAQYGKSSLAAGADKAERDKLANKLRAARQR